NKNPTTLINLQTILNLSLSTEFKNKNNTEPCQNREREHTSDIPKNETFINNYSSLLYCS
ncbi:hypothetical protein OFC49_39290, partial [Escherichia coli]|nr:hypothetical protein [Escherichia coli]